MVQPVVLSRRKEHRSFRQSLVAGLLEFLKGTLIGCVLIFVFISIVFITI